MSRRESGQAAVESALTLPLTVFLILGTLQLFMMLQGRIMAEYAAFQAVRAGSRNHGDCTAMTHAALAALVPNFSPFATPGGGAGKKLAEAWKKRLNGEDAQYHADDGSQHAGGAIFWLVRESPRTSDLTDVEDRNFDAPQDLNGGGTGGGLRLEVRLVYWFPLKIPFADWVMSRMFLAFFGLEPFTGTNPLMPTVKNSNWTAESAGSLHSEIAGQFRDRVMSGQYVFPIHATYGMRMMTPAKRKFFKQQNCGSAPNL